MFNISSLLEKARGRQTKDITKLNIIREALIRQANIDIPIKDIKYKSTTVTIKNLSSTARSVIFTKKQAILDEINNRNIIIKDIR